MCLTIYLLSDRPLVAPTDDAYPGLNLELVDAEYQYYTLEGIRKVANASVVYDVSAAGHCGCFFGYQKEMDSLMKKGFKSFGRYLAAHPEAELALYAVWDNGVGEIEPVRAEVPPSYFGGPGFMTLPRDILLRIVPEPGAKQQLRWDPLAPRTHEWLFDAPKQG